MQSRVVGHYTEFIIHESLYGKDHKIIHGKRLKSNPLYTTVRLGSLPIRHVAIPGKEAGSQLLRQRESAARSHEAVGPNRSS